MADNRLYNKISISLNNGSTYSYEVAAKNISVRQLANKVEKQILEDINSGKFDLNDTPESKDKKRKKDWKTSVLGVAMLAGSAASNSLKLTESILSTDQAQIAESAYTTVKGTGTLALSTFGGKWGAVIASFVGVIDGLVGQAIKNQIQLSYDNSRLWYNLTRNDIGRNSTYVYDYEQQKWTARDTERVKKNILNQNSSV